MTRPHARPARVPKPSHRCVLALALMALAAQAQAAPVSFGSGLRSTTALSVIGELSGPEDTALTTTLDGAPWTSRSMLSDGGVSADAYAGVSTQSLNARALLQFDADAKAPRDASAMGGATFLGVFDISQPGTVTLSLDYAPVATGTAGTDLSVTLKLGDDQVLDQVLTQAGHYSWSFASGAWSSGTLGLTLNAYAALMSTPGPTPGLAHAEANALFALDAAPVPEPAAGVLLALGLGLVHAARRRTAH